MWYAQRSGRAEATGPGERPAAAGRLGHWLVPACSTVIAQTWRWMFAKGQWPWRPPSGCERRTGLGQARGLGETGAVAAEASRVWLKRERRTTGGSLLICRADTDPTSTLVGEGRRGRGGGPFRADAADLCAPERLDEAYEWAGGDRWDSRALFCAAGRAQRDADTIRPRCRGVPTPQSPWRATRPRPSTSGSRCARRFAQAPRHGTMPC